MDKNVKSILIEGDMCSFVFDKTEQDLEAELLFDKALEKRPVSTDAIENALIHIKAKLRASPESEIHSTELGEWVMDELRNLDEVAYVRFASVYRSFQDVDAFEREIRKLQQKTVTKSEKNETI